MSSDSHSDLARTTLGVLFIGALIVGTFWILVPFLSALLWATMIVISTWPVLLWLQARLRGRRGLATTVMTIALLLVLLIPLTVSVGALVANTDKIAAWTKSLNQLHMPPPPQWVSKIPLRGPYLYAAWEHLASQGSGALAERVSPYVGKFLAWFAGRMGEIGGMILQFLITVIIAAVLYNHGETAARGVRAFAFRLAGSRGDQAAVLAAGSIRGVAMGVIVTAIVQTVIAAIGLAAGSVPGALILTAVIFILCLAQVGPILVLLPALIWKFYSGDILGGSLLLVFSIPAVTLDNIMRPILIKKGANQPLILIFAGVIGGMITLGITGIFVGPAILAVTYVLVKEWVTDMPQQVEPAPARTAQVSASHG